MKSSAIFCLFLAFLSLEANAISNLTDCHARGWSLKRVGTADAMRFLQLEDQCVAKFQITPNEAQISAGWRSEIEDPLRLKLRSVAIYEFSTLLPEELKDPNVPPLVLAQWHDNKKSGDKALRPPLAIRLRDGRFLVNVFNQKVIDKQGIDGMGIVVASRPALYNRWIQWKVKVYWALNHQGTAEVWMNGEKIVQYVGDIGYFNDRTAPYFKLGIYTTYKFDKPLSVLHTGYTRSYGEYRKCADTGGGTPPRCLERGH